MCECGKKNILNSNDSIIFEKKYLEEIKVDGDNWKTLYKCKYCGEFWEERDLDGRFGVDVELVKITKDYVSNNWGKKYLGLSNIHD